MPRLTEGAGAATAAESLGMRGHFRDVLSLLCPTPTPCPSVAPASPLGPHLSSGQLPVPPRVSTQCPCSEAGSLEHPAIAVAWSWGNTQDGCPADSCPPAVLPASDAQDGAAEAEQALPVPSGVKALFVQCYPVLTPFLKKSQNVFSKVSFTGRAEHRQRWEAAAAHPRSWGPSRAAPGSLLRRLFRCSWSRQSHRTPIRGAGPQCCQV